MEKYTDVEFVFNSNTAIGELSNHFKLICEIYADAKVCFDYAYNLEHPVDELDLVVISNSEPLRMLKYTAGRLALIELAKLYRKKDHLSLIKFICRIQSKYYGEFIGSFNIQSFVKRFEEIASDNSKVLGLRDKIFAHADKPSEVKRSKVYETGYNEVKQFFASTFELIDDLHQLMNIAPYHKIHIDRPFNPQLNQLIKLLAI